MSSMHPIIRWFHQLGSPPVFDRFAARWAWWGYALGLATMALGMWLALAPERFGGVPADYQQGDSFRILYIHVPSAWMSLLVYGLMALYAAIALIWRIKLCEILAMACAPIGAGFTLITLVTGSIWGKPMWGTWWDWDPRLTTELVLLFMYLGVMGLYAAIEDRRSAARTAGLLAIVGVVMLPVIRYSVVWWNSLHQGQTIRILGGSTMDASMIPPLVWLLIGTKFWFVGALLARARADNLRREAGKDWTRQPAQARGMRAAGYCIAAACLIFAVMMLYVYLGGFFGRYLDYIVAAYGVFVVVMAADYLIPQVSTRRQLRAIKRHAQRQHARTAANPAAMELKR